MSDDEEDDEDDGVHLRWTPLLILFPRFVVNQQVGRRDDGRFSYA